MIEVEVKAWVDDFREVRGELSKIGAEKIKTEHQEDVYFNAPHRDFAKTDEAFRIRKIPEGESFRIILTYKGAKMDDVSKTRKEVEVEIENAEKMALILENLGFFSVVTIRKERDIYFFQDFIITLDNVFEAGNFVEIEIGIDEGADYKESVDKIFKLYERLGITEGFERRSYLEILGV